MQHLLLVNPEDKSQCSAVDCVSDWCLDSFLDSAQKLKIKGLQIQDSHGEADTMEYGAQEKDGSCKDDTTSLQNSKEEMYAPVNEFRTFATLKGTLKPIYKDSLTRTRCVANNSGLEMLSIVTNHRVVAKSDIFRTRDRDTLRNRKYTTQN